MGLPISMKRLTVANLAIPPDMIKKRLTTWKCGQLPYGGKAILINFCLSSILTYMMNFYLLPKGTHHIMDSIRARFFWAWKEEVSHDKMGKPMHT